MTRIRLSNTPPIRHISAFLSSRQKALQRKADDLRRFIATDTGAVALHRVMPALARLAGRAGRMHR